MSFKLLLNSAFIVLAMMLLVFGFVSRSTIQSVQEKIDHILDTTPLNKSIIEMKLAIANDQRLVMEMMDAKNFKVLKGQWEEHAKNEEGFRGSLARAAAFASQEYDGDSEFSEYLTTLIETVGNQYETQFLQGMKGVYALLLQTVIMNQEWGGMTADYDALFNGIIKNSVDFEEMVKMRTAKAAQSSKQLMRGVVWRDMAMEIKASLAMERTVYEKLAHTYKEYTIPSETLMAEFHTYHDEATGWMRALLDGGKTSQGVVQRLDDPQLRALVETIAEDQKKILELTYEMVRLRREHYLAVGKMLQVNTFLNERTDEIIGVLESIDQLVYEDYVNLQKATKQQETSAKQQIIIFMLVSIFLALLFGRIISRKIINQLGCEPADIEHLAEHVSSHDLDAALNLSNKEQVGAYGSLVQMVRDLKITRTELHNHQIALEEMVRLRTEELEKTATKLQNALNIVNMGNWDMDIRHKTFCLAPEVFTILGQPYEEDMEFEKMLSFVHPDDRETVAEEIEQIIHGDQSEAEGEEWLRYDAEYRIIRPDGTVRYLHSKANVSLAHSGRPVKMSGALQDITELKETELAALEAKAAAEEATKAKGEFLANMSHEIRTPMNGILGFVNRLAKGEKDTERRKQFDVIRNSGQTLLSIINDILDFSKIESGKMELESHPHDVHHLVSDTVSIFSELVSTKHIDLESRVDEALPHCLMIDQVRLKQVIFNLLSNAVKFTPENGRVTLDLRHDVQSGMLHCSVTDTGVGIAKENLAKIFDAFGQEDSSTTRKFGGTGLGLSISSRLIAMMGGKLQVESTLGEGSRFYFDIPLHHCPENVVAEEGETQQVALHGLSLNGHLLVVEDNPTNQMLMSVILDDLGPTYEIADDGVEALKCFKEKRYDVILMDENMPNMNGVEATEHIRRLEREGRLDPTPIVAVTANAMAEDRERFISIGMDDYISKPYTEENIITVLSKYLTSVPRRTLDVTQETANPETEAEEIAPESVLDMDHIRRSLPFPEKTLTKLLGAFNASLDNSVERLRLAVEGGELKEIQAAAHGLKGAAANIRIEKIANLMEVVEQSCRMGETMDFTAAFKELQQMVAILKGEIEAYLASH